MKPKKPSKMKDSLKKLRALSQKEEEIEAELNRAVHKKTNRKK